MNKLLLALVSVSMTSAVMCNDVVEKAIEPVKEEVVVAQAVVAKKDKCSQCPSTESQAAEATADKVKEECPYEEAGKVCPCPQVAEASVQEQK